MTLDTKLATRLLGMQPCDSWQSGNMGSDGGPVFYKRCDHELDKCWNTKAASGFAFAGLPALSTDWRGTEKLLEAVEARGWSWEIANRFGAGLGARASITKEAAPPFDYYHAEAEKVPMAVALVVEAALEDE